MEPPPRWRLRCVHALFKRGRLCSRRASSTCNTASLVCARSPKISRITSWRSITRIFSSASSSQLRCCAGVNWLSKIITSQSYAFASSTNSLALPDPTNSLACGLRIETMRSCRMPKPRVSTNSRSSSSKLRVLLVVSSGSVTPISIARSTTVGLSLTSCTV